jgi:hypothetical protein
VAYLVEDQVNAWLASTKYHVDALEDELEAAVVGSSFAAVSTRYDTSEWLDDVTTPSLMTVAMSMLYAAWWLQRQISEDELTDQSYPIRLEERAMTLLTGIADATIDLPGVDPDPDLTAGRGPLFYPNDASTALWEDDPLDPLGSPRAFTMGSAF